VILPPSRKAIDWARIDRRVGEAYGLTPREIDALTLSEIATLCMPDEAGPAGGRAMTDAEVHADLAAARSLTPAQRLARARRRRDG
jgi:hypothetical protein